MNIVRQRDGIWYLWLGNERRLTFQSAQLCQDYIETNNVKFVHWRTSEMPESMLLNKSKK